MDTSIGTHTDIEKYLKTENSAILDGLHRVPNDSNKQRGSSVSTPSAQTSSPCTHWNNKGLLNNIRNVLNGSNYMVGEYERAIIEIQVLYGLRISEALSINYTDVNSNGGLRVKGLKRSENRLVMPVKCLDFWLAVRARQRLFGSNYNRYYFYRLYKKIGIYEVLVPGRKASVTHSFRYAFISELMNDGMPIEDIQRVIGHKSLKSTEHYVEVIKGK